MGDWLYQSVGDWLQRPVSDWLHRPVSDWLHQSLMDYALSGLSDGYEEVEISVMAGFSCQWRWLQLSVALSSAVSGDRLCQSVSDWLYQALMDYALSGLSDGYEEVEISVSERLAIPVVDGFTPFQG